MVLTWVAKVFVAADAAADAAETNWKHKVIPDRGDLINDIPELIQIMAWRRPGDKPLSESIIVSLQTHTYVTRPQWVNTNL